MQKKTSPSKLVVGDTSALVSLQTGGLLQEALSIVQLFVPHEVLNELKLHSRLDANTAAVLSLIRQGDITVCDMQNRRQVNELVSLFPKIDIGEAAAVVLAEERKIEVVITDDFQVTFVAFLSLS